MGILIEWFGHSCFRLTANGYSVVVDPYADDSVPGLPPLRIPADWVLCTHSHSDHCFPQAVRVSQRGIPCPFSVSAVSSFHDAEKGAKRGMNLIYVFEANGLRAVHFGDVGCRPSAAQLDFLGRPDAALIPVGGFYTIDAAEAKALAGKLNARVVIPMHYRAQTFGLSKIGPLSDFTKLCGDVVQYAESSILLGENTPKQTAVLTYRP